MQHQREAPRAFGAAGQDAFAQPHDQKAEILLHVVHQQLARILVQQDAELRLSRTEEAAVLEELTNRLSDRTKRTALSDDLRLDDQRVAPGELEVLWVAV